MNERPTLAAVPGGRAALEEQALLAIPFDFQKFLEISRSLKRPANSPLSVVPSTTPDTGDVEPRPSGPR